MENNETLVTKEVNRIMDCLGDNIINALDDNGISHGSIDRLQPNYGDDAYLLWLNALNKRINPIPRKVFFSNELKKRMGTQEFTLAADVKEFAERFEKGINLNGHLSTRIYDADSWDYILNYWNIRHLHLNIQDANNKEEMHQNRSDNLLFFILADDAVYFLDVIKHPHSSGFTSMYFLNIADDNGWLHLCGAMLLDEALPGSVSPKIESDQDIYNCYKNQLNIILEVHGKYYNFMGSTSFGNRMCDSIRLTSVLKKQIYQTVSKKVAAGIPLNSIGVALDIGVLYLLYEDGPVYIVLK